MGLAPAIHASTKGNSPGYVGIFRNCTCNMRTLLGWPPMAENQYSNVLYYASFDAEFKLLNLHPLNTGGHTIHDVRLSSYGMMGCEKANGTFYPVKLVWRDKRHLGAGRLLESTSKNWNFLPAGWIDAGWIDDVGLSRIGNGSARLIESPPGRELRGSAPAFMLGNRMIATYHTVTMEDNRRNYWHYFAELDPNPPFPIIALSTPFKLGRGGDAGRIQFLMACFPEQKDASSKIPEHCIVSFGEADADNCIGRIKTADIFGLML